MKKILTLLAILILSSQMKASHLMGGQLTAAHVGQDSVKLNLTLYRDTTGIFLDTLSAQVFMTQGTFCNWPGNLYLMNFIGYTSLGNGVQEYNFELLLDSTNYQILDSDTNQYLFSFNSCCRNTAIVNLSNPGGESFQLETTFKNHGAINSTPEFLNAPVTTAQIGVPFSYNPLPFDADGDSLSWYLDIPWSDCLSPCAGYYLPSAINNDFFKIDSTTGQITWTPAMIGNWNSTVMIDEYRNGVKIGYVRRDMQIIVLDSASFGTGSSPKVYINNVSLPNQQAINFTINANLPFNLATKVQDQDNNDLKITIAGEPLIVSNPAITNIVNGTTIATATFAWTPNSTHVRENSYLSTIRVYEKNPSSVYIKVSDITLGLKVVESPLSVGSNTNVKNSITAVPNPTRDMVSVTLETQSSGNANLQVFDITGKLIVNDLIKLQTGLNGYLLNTNNWANGLYTIKANGQTTRLLVQH